MVGTTIEFGEHLVLLLRNLPAVTISGPAIVEPSRKGVIDMADRPENAYSADARQSLGPAQLDDLFPEGTRLADR